MYFGSVRFFKDLIISILVLVFIALGSLLAFFIVGYNNQKAEVAECYEKNSVLLDNAKLFLPDGKNFDEAFEALKKEGLTAEEISAKLAPPVESLPVIAPPPAETAPENTVPNGAPDYTELYPNLYAEPPTEFVTPDKTIYLTFDDGPSNNTLQILSILKKHDIKATFFMTGAKTDEQKAIMKKVADEGHTIGMHAYTHNYDQLYTSVESYLADMDEIYRNISDCTGTPPTIFRFPGGSINDYNRFLYKQLIAETARRGFVYYDWDVSGEDAKEGATWTSIYRSVLGGIKEMDGKSSIILLHDAADKERTVLVTEDLILALGEKGYSFDKLQNSIAPTTFGYIS